MWLHAAYGSPSDARHDWMWLHAAYGVSSVSGGSAARSVKDSPMLLPRTSMGASFQSHVSPWPSIDRTIGVSFATCFASVSTAHTASRG
jgi:hypothetical protein